MSTYKNLDEIPEIEELQPGDKLFAIVNKKLDNTYLSYRFDMNILSSHYFPIENIQNLIDELPWVQQQFTDRLDKLVDGEWLSENNYIKKRDANIKRTKLLTLERLSALLDNYLTYPKLSSDVQECIEHAEDSAATMVDFMSNFAINAKRGQNHSEGMVMVSDGLENVADSMPESSGGGD